MRVTEVHNKSMSSQNSGPFNITRTRVTKHLEWRIPRLKLDIDRHNTDPISFGDRAGQRDSYSRTMTKNPFYFTHFGVRKIEVNFDEWKFKLKTDFPNQKTAQAYYQLFSKTELLVRGMNCDISLKEF